MHIYTCYLQSNCLELCSSVPVNDLWFAKRFSLERGSVRKIFTEHGLHQYSSKTASMTFVCHLMLEDTFYV